jgi:hypothetical protein
MEYKLPSAGRAPVSIESLEELFETLSGLPLSIFCPKCGAKLLHVQATFFSDSGKVWTLQLPVCSHCELPSGARPDPTGVRETRNYMVQFNKRFSSAPSLDKAAPSSTPSAPTWREMYQKATLEHDLSKLPDRIKDARRAILDRAEEIMSLPAGGEQRALSHAFHTLRVLEEVVSRDQFSDNSELQLGA